MARVLLGVTGSVAAVKIPELVAALTGAGHTVKLALTEASLTFFDPASLQASAELGGPELPVRGQSSVYLDADEWPEGRLFHVGEPVLHIELRKWADALVIAPLDANTLAKMAQGLCDNLLTCVYRAWDPSRPVVLAPAMNTLMWTHPVTRRQLCQILDDHHHGSTAVPVLDQDSAVETINALCPRLHVVSPVSKRLACGDEGMGGMADVSDIVAALGSLL